MVQFVLPVQTLVGFPLASQKTMNLLQSAPNTVKAGISSGSLSSHNATYIEPPFSFACCKSVSKLGRSGPDKKILFCTCGSLMFSDSICLNWADDPA